MEKSHSVEKREILSHRKIFRQINSLVTYLVKPLFSRNFCQKCVRENFRNFHTVCGAVIFLFLRSTAQCEDDDGIKNFAQIVIFRWIDENFKQFIRIAFFPSIWRKLWMKTFIYKMCYFLRFYEKNCKGLSPPMGWKALLQCKISMSI